MRMTIEKDKIKILPDDIMDESYLENVLGLRKDNDSVVLKRKSKNIPPIGFDTESEKYFWAETIQAGPALKKGSSKIKKVPGTKKSRAAK